MKTKVCPECGHWNGEHHQNCPEKPEEREVENSTLTKMNTYKQIPAEMRKHGCNMKLVSRVGDVAIYRKSAGFEVLVVRRHDGRTIPATADNPERIIEPAEYLPSDEEFGRFGWYYIGPDALELAEAKQAEVNSRPKAKAA